MNNIFIISLIIIILLSRSISYAMLPFENGFYKYYVRQGYGQCVPASFYIIFKFYGEDRQAPGLFNTGETGVDGKISYKMLKLTRIIPGNEFPRLTKETEIAKWNNPSD